MLKVNQKVRIIGKSIGSPIKDTVWNIGDIAYINEIKALEENTLLYSGLRYYLKCLKGGIWCDGVFMYNDLESMEKSEYVLKYEIDQFSLKYVDILQATEPSDNEKDNFLIFLQDQMGLKATSIIPINAQLMEYVESKDACFLEWLLGRGFIKERHIGFDFIIPISSPLIYKKLCALLKDCCYFTTLDKLVKKGEKHGYK